MALSDSIGRAISQTNQVAGVVSGLSPLLPQSVRDSLGELFGFKKKPPSPRGLNLMLSKLNKLNGVSRPSLFYVKINPPLFLNAVGKVTEDLQFLTESCSLPGISLATTDIRRFGYGPTEKKPYAPIFTDQTMTFLGDGRGTVHKFFYQWLNGMVKFNSPNGDTSLTVKGSAYGVPTFEVAYKTQYRTDIEIVTYDELHRQIIIVKMYDAYPIFMGDVALNWNDTDSIMRIPITFSYFNWERTNISIDYTAGEKPTDNSLSLLQKLNKVGNAIQTLSTIRKPRNVADVINAVNNSQIAVGKF